MRQFECKFYACWQNKLSAVVRKTFLCQQDFFGRKYPSEIFEVFLSFLYFERNVLSLSVEKSWNNCENSTLRILNINFLAKTKTNWNFPKMFKFLVYSEKKFAKKFRQTCQKCTYIVNSNILRESNFFKDLIFFCMGLRVKFFVPYAKKSSSRLSKLILDCPLQFFRKKVFFFKFLETFHCSRTLSGSFRAFLVEKTRKGCQISLIHVENIILMKNWKTHKDIVFESLLLK